MERPIKFRGRIIDTGEFVYGDLQHDDGEILINDWEVDPKSVAQLVGYDKYGREIYEGDIVITLDGKRKSARLTASFLYEHYFDSRIDFYGLTLKEA